MGLEVWQWSAESAAMKSLPPLEKCIEPQKYYD
jgi:hypothetical protein